MDDEEQQDVSENPEEGAPELEEESSGGMKKMILILIPIILIGVGAGLYFTGMLDGLLGKKDETQVEGAETAGAEEAAPEPETAYFVELPDIIVNLNSSSQRNFMRLKVKLEVSKEEDIEAVTNVLPRVIDKFQTFLREMRIEDMRGRAGTYRIRQELLYRVNLAVEPVVVKDVLFQDILIQ